MKHAIAVLLIGLAAGPLAAQTIWRCGPDARQFQATPCAGGSLVAVQPRPTPEAVAAARAVAARERLALQTLSAQRHARERDAVAGPAGIAVSTAEDARKAQEPKGSQKKAAQKTGKGRKPVRPAPTEPEA